MRGFRCVRPKKLEEAPEEDFERFVCEYELELELLRIMECGELPLDAVRNAYDGIVPIFGDNFMAAVMERLEESLEFWHPLLFMLFSGPIENLKRMNWDRLMPMLIQAIPLSFEVILAAVENSVSDSDFDMRLSFVRCGGIEAIDKKGIPADMSSCARILLGLAKANVIFVVPCKSVKTVVELSTPDFDPEIIEFPSHDIVYDIFDKLFESPNEETRSILLKALLSIAEHNPRDRGAVANTIATHTEKLVVADELILAIRVLSVCGKVCGLGYLSSIVSKVPILLKNASEEDAETIFGFLDEIIDLDCGEMLWDFGVVDTLVKYMENATYRMKMNSVGLAIKLTNDFSPRRLADLIPLGIVRILLSVIDEDPQGNITNAVKRIWEFVIHRRPDLKKFLYDALNDYDCSENDFMANLLEELQT